MYYYNYQNQNDNRTFLVPLILGGLGGAAIVGVSRPRPVYVNPVYQAYPPNGYYGGYNYYQYYR